MSRQAAITTLVACILAGLASLSRAEETRHVLQTNPFERPAIEEKQETVAMNISQAPARALKLRATMVAGADSLANIGGMIIGIGQEIDGYQLLSVREREVILGKNGSTKTLSVDD
jgi:hypothetical protein